MANIQCLIWPSTCLYSLLDSWLKMLCPCCEETHLFMRGKVSVTLCLYRQNSIGNIFDILKLSLGVWVVVLRPIVSWVACTMTEAFSQSPAFLMMVTLAGRPCLRSLIIKLGRLYSTHRNFENREQSQKIEIPLMSGKCCSLPLCQLIPVSSRLFPGQASVWCVLSPGSEKSHDYRRSLHISLLLQKCFWKMFSFILAYIYYIVVKDLLVNRLLRLLASYWHSHSGLQDMFETRPGADVWETDLKRGLSATVFIKINE